ncbi:hypothetical protein ABZ547_22480 [Streptomyces sparsogenes]|uniref:hypothetical protein n=1 Tax=Streptomyces sparsogenes TaxID=67365 RepID=UPI0033E9B33E
MAHAIRFHATGGPDVLRWEATAIGDPGRLVSYSVDDPPVLRTRPPGYGPRYQRSEQLPLQVGEFMTTYHGTMIHHQDDL